MFQMTVEINIICMILSQMTEFGCNGVIDSGVPMSYQMYLNLVLI